MNPFSHKVFSALLFLLLPLSTVAQLNGAYSRDGEAYTFNSNGTFSWMQVTDAITYGNGTYKINGKKIDLTFEKGRLQIDIQLNEVNPGNPSIVETRIMYSNGQPASGAAISLIQSGIRQYVNNIGVLKLELAKPIPEDKVVIDVNNRQSAGIPITLRGNNILLGIVIDETSKYKENVTETVSFKMKRNKILINKKTFRKTEP